MKAAPNFRTPKRSRKFATDDHPVIIDVRGFASSKEFEHCPVGTSHKLNLELAEERRTEVINSLRLSIPSQRTLVIWLEGAARWTRPEEMYAHSAINDMPAGELLREPERLARYVEIKVLDASACQAPREVSGQ